MVSTAIAIAPNSSPQTIARNKESEESEEKNAMHVHAPERVEKEITKFSGNENKLSRASFGIQAEEFHECEFGVVGMEQEDESHYMQARYSNTSDDANTASNIPNKRISIIRNEEEKGQDEDGSKPFKDYADEHDTARGRIHFSKRKLYGRNEELKILASCFDALVPQQQSSPNESPQSPQQSQIEQPQETSPRNSNVASSQVLFLSGYSGSGKTRLVREGVRKFTERSQVIPIYIEGKYDELQTSDSYRGISEAFGRWYKNLSKEGRQNFRNIQQDLEEEVGEDAMLLGDILPGLKRLLFPNEQETSHVSEDGSTSNFSLTRYNSSGRADFASTSFRTVKLGNNINKSQVHHVFNVFMKLLCTPEAPCVMFIDDLQYADTESLELLSSFLSNASEGHVVFVGAFRSNEVDAHHPLTSIMDTLRSKRAKSNFHMLELSDLSLSHVQEFIGDSLSLDVDAVGPLTKAIYSKTLGNMFFTMQALEQLVRNNALYYDMISFQWQWVLSQEQLEGLLSNEVVEMVKSKIENMTPEMQLMLIVASYTRTTFDVDTLLSLVSIVIKREGWDILERVNSKESPSRSSVDWNLQYLRQLLDEAVLEGLLVDLKDKADRETNIISKRHEEGKREMESESQESSCEFLYEYAFAHDRICEAARSLVDGETKEKLLLRLGTALARRGLSVNGKDWMLYTALFHLNSISMEYHNPKERLGLAKMHLETSQLSMSKASFENAAYFASKGLEWLGEEKWERNTTMTRQLYVIAAEAYRIVGNIEKMEACCNEFLEAQKSEPLSIKFSIYYNLACGIFYGSSRFKEAKDIVLMLLKELNCKFPENAGVSLLKTGGHLIRLKMTKKKRTLAAVERMERMIDPNKIETMRLLDLLFDICYLTADTALFPLVIIKALNYTLKYGFCKSSPRLVASVCILFMGVLNDIDGSVIYGNFALNLMEKSKDRPTECGAAMFAYVFAVHYTSPYTNCVAPMRKYYDVGMQTGDVLNAQWCFFYVIVFGWLAGHPLSMIQADCEKYIPAMSNLNQRLIECMCKFLWRAVLGLMGRSKESAEVVLDEEEYENEIMMGVLYSIERVELGYLGDFEACANSCVKSAGFLMKKAPGAAVVIMDLLPSALSCIKMLRRTGKAEYKKEFYRIYNKFKSWGKQGNPNVGHILALLDAEIAAWKKQKKLASKKYDLAVRQARSSGLIHGAMLATECWGDFALEILDDKQVAKDCIREAIALCSQWGANAKLLRLKQKLRNIDSPTKEIRR